MKNNDAWKPLSNFFYIPFILFSFSSILSSEILIDGELSEKEWQTAREINKFYEVFPFSLNDVSVDDVCTGGFITLFILGHVLSMNLLGTR